MYKQNDEQTLSIQTNLTLGELETKSLHLCQIKTCYTSLHIQNLLRTQIFIDCGLFLALQLILTIFFSVISTYLALYQYSPRHCTEQSVLCYAVSILIFDRLRLSGIERSNYLKTNNLGRKNCPVSGIERIRYSGCFITLKIEGKNSGPTKSSGFVGIPVLRGSGLAGFYCITKH